MSNIKERILGAITVMTDDDARIVWQLIKEQFSKTWDDIDEVEPDEWDLEMLKEIENNPDCKEFINSKDINWNDLGDMNR